MFPLLFSLVQGIVPEDHAARLVRNRGPITAKVTATGTRRVPGNGSGSGSGDSVSRFSLVAWKFAGDDGLVRGIMEEEVRTSSPDDDGYNRRGLTIDVDCMKRDGKVAIVGGEVRDDDGHKSRAYVRVVDSDGDGYDYISNVYLDDDVSTAKLGCRAPLVEENLSRGYDDSVDDVVGSIVSVCSKHGDWEGCLRKRARIEEAMARVDRAIE